MIFGKFTQKIIAQPILKNNPKDILTDKLQIIKNMKLIDVQIELKILEG